MKKVGIVTAKTGAAVHDMIQIATRRNPYVQLYLYPAKVQGEGAAQSIAKGISFLDEFGVDVILAGRGGGSMEDARVLRQYDLAVRGAKKLTGHL